MEEKLFVRIRESLGARRQNLTRWFDGAPSRKKQVLLGPATEEEVRAHLHSIDTALEKAAAETLGRCEVCDEFVGEELLQMDYTTCVCLDHFSTEQVRHLERELELAQKVQQTLLPQQVPETPALEIAAFSRPAQIVGGDYFDFYRYQRGAHGLAIADVSGHGVSASLHMASLQTLLRTLVPEGDAPVDVVRQLQRLYTHNIEFPTYVTLFLGAVDTTRRTLTYCNAGHNPPLVLRRNGGQVRWLRPTGPAIGLIEAFVFGQEDIALQPGDTLLLYTDGVTEAANAQFKLFGPDRLATLAARGASLPARELIQTVLQALDDFTEGKPLDDDTTIVVCRLAGG